jgi:hypothetical protein
MVMALRRLAVLALLVLAACTKSDPPSPTASSAPSSSSSAAAPLANEARDAGDTRDAAPLELSEAMLGLGPRLAAEAKSRPRGAVPAEDVFEMAKSAGASLDAPKQHLAAAWKAAYCIASQNPAEDFVVDVCEYADEKAAREGEGISKKGFSNIPGREVHRSGATLLTLRVGKPSPENKALAAKIVEGFAKLKAPKK